jgi:hypothetical protein
MQFQLTVANRAVGPDEKLAGKGAPASGQFDANIEQRSRTTRDRPGS